MSNTLTHKFASAKADGSDATRVLASNWNAEHAFSGGSLGSLLYRDSGQSDGARWLSAPTVDVRLYGAVGNGVTDATTAIQAAITALSSGGTVYLPTGTYLVSTTLQINTRGIMVQGDGYVATTINFTGTGALIQLGTDNGHAYDAADYDGVQGFRAWDLTLTYTGTTTATLDNGLGTYGPGRYAIRDWRGGVMDLRRLKITNFDYGFWGIQSDINYFEQLFLQLNHSAAIYLGPRSDQAIIVGGWSFNNDRLLWLDGCQSTRVIGWQTDGDGTLTTPPIKIGTQWIVTANGIDFVDCWFEQTHTGPGIEAFVEIGVGDTLTARDISFRNTFLALNLHSGTPHADYVLKIGTADRIRFDHISGISNNDLLHLTGLIEFVGTTSPNVLMTLAKVAIVNTTDWVNNGSGAPTVVQRWWTGVTDTLIGRSVLQQDALANTSTDGFTLQNTTPASGGTTSQFSPRLKLTGAAWNSSALQSETNNWIVEGQPQTAAGTTDIHLIFSRNVNSGAFSEVVRFTNLGLRVVAGGSYTFSGRGRINDGGADGKINLANNGTTAGIGFDVTTDGLLKIRNRAQNADGDASARNVTVSSSIINKTKAGTPVDGDVTNAADGMLVVDTTASKIWVRTGGAWKGVAVA